MITYRVFSLKDEMVNGLFDSNFKPNSLVWFEDGISWSVTILSFININLVQNKEQCYLIKFIK